MLRPGSLVGPEVNLWWTKETKLPVDYPRSRPALALAFLLRDRAGAPSMQAPPLPVLAAATPAPTSTERGTRPQLTPSYYPASVPLPPVGRSSAPTRAGSVPLTPLRTPRPPPPPLPRRPPPPPSRHSLGFLKPLEHYAAVATDRNTLQHPNRLDQFRDVAQCLPPRRPVVPLYDGKRNRGEVQNM